jgi:4-aminobutyrate aminotransferase-like enzyme
MPRQGPADGPRPRAPRQRAPRLDTLRFMPSLLVSHEEIDEMLAVLRVILEHE